MRVLPEKKEYRYACVRDRVPFWKNSLVIKIYMWVNKNMVYEELLLALTERRKKFIQTHVRYVHEIERENLCILKIVSLSFFF